jgi:hypothetical protein
MRLLFMPNGLLHTEGAGVGLGVGLGVVGGIAKRIDKTPF